MHNSETISDDDALGFVKESGIDASQMFDIDIIGVAGAGYYEQKNAGAEICDTEIIVLVDSDLVLSDGWLSNLLGSFNDPLVNFVYGATAFETNTLYEKSFALTIASFPLGSGLKRGTETTLTPARHLLANNFAYKKSVMGAAIFPDSIAYRGQCTLASENIRKAGETIYFQKAARASHPAPNGARHFFERAFIEGHDEYVLSQRNETPGVIGMLKRSVVGATSRFIKATLGAWGRSFTKRDTVGLSVLGTPAVITVSFTYYFVRYMGELITAISPKLMRASSAMCRGH